MGWFWEESLASLLQCRQTTYGEEGGKVHLNTTH